MKTIITLIMLLTPVALIAQEIGVIREFSKRSPAFPLEKRSNVAAGDVNGDGIPEIIVLQGTNILLVDPTDPNIIYLTVDLSEGGTEVAVEELEFIGLVEFSGEKYVIIEASASERDVWMAFTGSIIGILVGLKDEEIVYAGEGRIVSILKSPSGRSFIVQYVEQENIFKLVGDYTEDGSVTADGLLDPGVVLSSSHGRVQSFSRSVDYILEDKYRAESGSRPAFDPDLFDPLGETDINGDGIADLQMFIHNEQNGVSGMVVRSGDSLEILWQFTFPEEQRNEFLQGFHGFIDADADGEKEAIFGDNLAVTLDGTVHEIAEDFIIIDIDDFDNDGFEDIMGWNTADSSVHIYGASTEVVAVSETAGSPKPLFQTYPNPFDQQVHINYSLQKVSKVEAAIYDINGKLVKQILNVRQSPGAYQLTWNGRDDGGWHMNSGVYLCTMKIDNLLDTRRMLYLGIH